jgi:hypothetical protein
VWTKIARPKYERAGQRYVSDLTDAEWTVIELHMRRLSIWGGRARPICEPSLTAFGTSRGPAVGGACCRRTFRRSPPCKTTFMIGGTTVHLNGSISNSCSKREAAGRVASPSAEVIDSQSVKTTESGGPRGGAYPRARQSRDPGDTAQKVKGRKRHIVTNTTGLRSMSRFIPPISRTAMERYSLLRPSTTCFPGCATSSPTAPIPATSSLRHSPLAKFGR